MAACLRAAGTPSASNSPRPGLTMHQCLYKAQYNSSSSQTRLDKHTKRDFNNQQHNQTSPTMKSTVSALVVVLVAMVSLCSYQAQGQSYHFSNGWNPGKRSSTTEQCHFRTEVKTLVFKLIEDEVLRMLTEPACTGRVSSIASLLKKNMGYEAINDEKRR